MPTDPVEPVLDLLLGVDEFGPGYTLVRKQREGGTFDLNEDVLSLGGLYVRMYAARYPDETGGVVLIDSSHPEQFTRSARGRAAYEQTRRLASIFPLLSGLGVIRLFNLIPAPPDLPPHQREQIEAFNSSTKQVATAAEEFRATPQMTAQVRRAGSLGDKPLAVVSASEHLPPVGPKCRMSWPPSRQTASTV